MDASPGVVIFAVGEEVLAGRITDTNSAHLATCLSALGYRVTAIHVVGDEPGGLSRALSEWATGAPVVIASGGLGPTEDDRTREEMARAAGVALEWREDAWQEITRFFAGRGVTDPPARNRRQAWFPAGAEVIPNPAGTAPAFRLRVGSGWWWSLPGVPAELRVLLDRAVIPALLADVPPPAASAAGSREVLRFCGVPEAELDTWLVDALGARKHELQIRATNGELDVRLPPGVSLAASARARFSTAFLGEGDLELAARVVALAREAGARIGVAESCTGGLLAARLTAVPGASDVFMGGWVVYTNALKESALGVPASLLASKGAVSREVAVHLAWAARDRSGATHGASLTGIAGPTGGTPEKPVGTVHVALAGPAGCWWRQCRFHGDRDQVRARATTHVLHALHAALRGATLPGWHESGPPGAPGAE